MRFFVTLSNSGGELDRKDFEISDSAFDLDEAVSIAALEAIEDWTLSVGDTIRICELSNG